MRKLLLAAACIALVGLAPCAYAVQVEVHGDLNHRAQVTDQVNFFTHKVTPTYHTALDGVEGQYVDFKYRLWAEMASDDNAVKGVYAIEIGGIKFGDSANGGGYSGDGKNIETRWAYTDFMLGNGRMKIGLQPWSVNSFVWTETATAIQYGASAGMVDYELGWARPKNYYPSSANKTDDDPFIEDADALMGRVNFGIGEGSKAGVFVLYQMSNPSKAAPGVITANDWYVKDFGDVDMNIWTLGLDGKLQTAGPLFINWDVMFQTGQIDNVEFRDVAVDANDPAFSSIISPYNDYDLSAYFGHVDIGAKLGKLTLTYTGWYASGDSKSDDDDFEAFLATDVDRTESIIFMEGGYPDEAAYTDRPYIADKGLFLNKVAADYQATDKVKVGGALLYLQLAEDIEYTDDLNVARSSKDLGFEVDAYISYQMYKNLEIALNAGYLLSGDAMDVFENTTDGAADEDVFRTTAKIEYKF